MSDLYTNKTMYGDRPLETNETIAQDKTISPETQPPKLEKLETSVSVGTSIDDYFITELISDEGNEANVYVARKNGNDYALKIYKRKINVSNSKLSLLQNIDCEYVTKIRDYGNYKESFYEVYDYFKNGTLENLKKVDPDKIKSYINQINEGINSLHNLNDGTGIIHGDIKPSNIFVSDDREHVVIGDFGISSIVEDGDYNISDMCGTPEFAPPSTGVVNKVKKTTAFDYGSFGLVVFYMATGYSYFANMSTTGITETWAKGIEIPDTLDTRIKMLLKGLLCDEKERFGYKEVKDWYDGSFVHVVKPKDVFAKKKTSNVMTLWFGVIDNENIDVSSVSELVTQMKKHWKQAKYKLKDENLFSFLNQFDNTHDLVEEIRKIVKENDEDSAVFKVIYTLSSDSDIVYKGKNYGDAAKFISELATNPDDDAREIILKNLFHFYISKMGYSDEVMCIINEIISLNGCSERVKVNILNYVFSKNKAYNNWNTIEEMRADVSNMSLQEIDELSDNEEFIAWLYSQGLKELSMEMANYGGMINE